LKKQRIDTAKSKYAKAKEKETKKSKTAGKKWFDMAAPELTDEVSSGLFFFLFLVSVVEGNL
jgi:hypothetical protein